MTNSRNVFLVVSDLFHSSLHSFGNVFLFVMGVLTELMLFVLNNQITKTRKGLRRTCDLNVIFFLLNKWKILKEGCSAKQTIIVILKVLHRQKMNSWAIGQQFTVSGTWSKRVLQHQCHCKKLGRLCLYILLHNVYLLGDGYLVLTWVMTFHIVKTKLFNLYCSWPSCVFKPLNVWIFSFVASGILFLVSVLSQN